MGVSSRVTRLCHCWQKDSPTEQGAATGCCLAWPKGWLADAGVLVVLRGIAVARSQAEHCWRSTAVRGCACTLSLHPPLLPIRAAQHQHLCVQHPQHHF